MMARIISRVWPRSLVGQIVLVAAIALFVAQAFGAFMLLGTMRARALNEATITLVQRMGNHVERQAEAGKAAIDQSKFKTKPNQPVFMEFGSAPITVTNFEVVPEFQDRAIEMFEMGNTPLSNVTLRVGDLKDVPAEIRAQQIARAKRRLQHRSFLGVPREAMLLTAQTSDGRWISGVTSVRPRERRSLWALFFQTVMLYFAVLIPLLLIARRIAKPLAGLKESVQLIGGNEEFVPMQPAGPDDVRNLMTAFNAMQVRVSSLLFEKDVMLGAIGHDLKTPLASLRVRIESVDDDTEREKMAATVEEMVQMLDDILTLARNGKSGEDAVRTDIGALVDSVVQDFSGILPSTEFIPPSERIVATVRPILLRRAIRNLIDNAIKHGGGVLVSITSDASRLQILVDDNGPGIAPDQLEALFEPFARAEASRGRATGGSGLGLTIARAIARNHNGDIVLRNRDLGEDGSTGLCAIIDLPLY